MSEEEVVARTIRDLPAPKDSTVSRLWAEVDNMGTTAETRLQFIKQRLFKWLADELPKNSLTLPDVSSLEEATFVVAVMCLQITAEANIATYVRGIVKDIKETEEAKRRCHTTKKASVSPPATPTIPPSAGVSPHGIFGRKPSDVKTPFPPLSLDHEDDGHTMDSTIVSTRAFVRQLTPRLLDRELSVQDMVEIVRKEDFLIRLSQLHQMYGCPAHLIELSLRKASVGIGLPSRCSVLATVMLVSFGEKAANETMFVDMVGGYHLQKLELVDFVARRCASGDYLNNMSQAVQDLDAIMAAPDPWADWVVLSAFSISSGIGASVFFRGWVARHACVRGSRVICRGQRYEVR